MNNTLFLIEALRTEVNKLKEHEQTVRKQLDTLTKHFEGCLFAQAWLETRIKELELAYDQETQANEESKPQTTDCTSLISEY